MILHAASIAALFVDQTQPTQCVPTLPDSPWKWIIQSVIPVAGGTLIAVWSFVQNRKSEQKQWERNQRAGHEQWIQDQKKAEWRELLNAVRDSLLHCEISSFQNATMPKLAPVVALERDRIISLYQVVDSRIFIESKVIYPIRDQLNELLAAKICYEEAGGAASTMDSKWANAIWVPGTKHTGFADAVSSAARTDLGIEFMNMVTKSNIRNS
ncbi:MAG: hypothetical protein ACLQKY_03150 [Terracidiphilus sp.]